MAAIPFEIACAPKVKVQTRGNVSAHKNLVCEAVDRASVKLSAAELIFEFACYDPVVLCTDCYLDVFLTQTLNKYPELASKLMSNALRNAKRETRNSKLETWCTLHFMVMRTSGRQEILNFHSLGQQKQKSQKHTKAYGESAGEN